MLLQLLLYSHACGAQLLSKLLVQVAIDGLCPSSAQGHVVQSTGLQLYPPVLVDAASQLLLGGGGEVTKAGK